MILYTKTYLLINFRVMITEVNFLKNTIQNRENIASYLSIIPRLKKITIWLKNNNGL